MPQLQPVVDDIATVAEPLRQFYVQKDGKYHVDLSAPPVGFAKAEDLAAANGKIVEFRDNNIKLTKTVEELTPLKEQFKDLDPVAARAAIAKVAELEKKGIKGTDDLSVLLKDTVLAAITPLKTEIEGLKSTTAAEKKRADDAVFQTTIAADFTKAGGEPSALEFIVSRAKGVFTINDGAVKALPNVFSIDRPGEPMSVSEWLTRQTTEVGFAFKPSQGGGARAADAGAAGNHRAGVEILKNPTPQQLGERMKDIRAGKVRVVNDADAALTQ